uniref:Mosc domain-containing protein n=2 Tax=Tetraselmis sp. GSL018 TaxID=582737 RepID=A0A061SB27_9CHLO|mmetsp:Transcript_33062/g.78413  ORF Transcript_33062/g.78413 Transcript_33062/m.78413 type:complete len:323 (+) Transcript_33062:192-1160(+)|eukprot:CAMPEP_0177591206 /NCGR_PEP_ID=MMETSP0419_2-20121207/7865_1 /TAXON_ID=582737 /ORGANISM="Tetraselmis sp., Strain GSL018" /LENGTH=322 /DNA_ID=CAMNT_0019081915 /DNA_START=93 /DNA_END=1061 /DNA_ORIENTATION=-
MPKVISLHIYPVKSCGGIALQTATVSRTGFAFDRQWVVVDAETGNFLTQRQNPTLALITSELPPEALLDGWGSLPPEAALSLSAPGMDPLQVPLEREGEALGAGKMRDVRVWEWRGPATDEGDAAAEWLSAVLGQRCRLVRHAGQEASSLDDPTRRRLDPHWVDPALRQETAFADAFPFLLASAESLADLNRRLEKDLPMDRFRPNIVVEGLSEPWEEDKWAAVEVIGAKGPVSFKSVKPCARCQVTTVDQQTAVVGREPLPTLSRFRGKTLGWNEVDKTLSGCFFGWNLITDGIGTTISVGDTLTPSQWRDPRTLKPVTGN